MSWRQAVALGSKVYYTGGYWCTGSTQCSRAIHHAVSGRRVTPRAAVKNHDGFKLPYVLPAGTSTKQSTKHSHPTEQISSKHEFRVLSPRLCFSPTMSSANASVAITDTVNHFDKLPDDILLNIFHNLTDFHLCCVRRVCKRFESVSKDRELTKNVSFKGCYQVSSAQVIKYLQPVQKTVESLDLNYCYWLSAQCCDVITKCCNLVSLHILHISITTQRLVNLLASLEKLQYLSASIRNVREFPAVLDKNQKAQETMKGIRVLTFQVKNLPVHGDVMTMQFLAVTSFFEYCSSLEEFHVQGMFCTKGVPPYVLSPQIKSLDNLKKIHTLTVSDAMDPFARMFFFGTLLEICKLPEIRLRTLLQPLVVNEYLQRKDHFVKCISHIEELQNLDISQTVAAIPNEVYQLERAVLLQYLNVADNSLIDSQSLHLLADNCPQLISINLRDCHRLHFKRPQEGEASHEHLDMSGLQSLVVNCTALRDINVSGVHIHSADLIDSGYTSLCDLLAVNTQWRSLSLSPCCLNPRSKSLIYEDKPGKRARIFDSHEILAKRPRLGVQAPNLNLPLGGELCTELGKLVSACPHVEEFELIGAGFRSTFNRRRISQKMQLFVPCSSARTVDEQDILCIRQWKQLRYLQLSAVPGINGGQSLGAIVKGCPQLQRLLLAHLGPTPACNYQDSLMMSLPYAQKLKDLRIEQSHMHLRESLWSGLSKTKALERVCFVTKSAEFKQPIVEQFVSKMPLLVVLQLFVSNTMKDCNQLQTSLMAAHKKQRPAMSVCVLPLLNKFNTPLPSIPDYHVETLTILSSTVCIRPPSWNSMDS